MFVVRNPGAQEHASILHLVFLLFFSLYPRVGEGRRGEGGGLESFWKSVGQTSAWDKARGVVWMGKG